MLDGLRRLEVALAADEEPQHCYCGFCSSCKGHRAVRKRATSMLVSAWVSALWHHVASNHHDWSNHRFRRLMRTRNWPSSIITISALHTGRWTQSFKIHERKDYCSENRMRVLVASTLHEGCCIVQKIKQKGQWITKAVVGASEHNYTVSWKARLAPKAMVTSLAVPEEKTNKCTSPENQTNYCNWWCHLYNYKRCKKR